jgi:uncharacterized protein
VRPAALWVREGGAENAADSSVRRGPGRTAGSVTFRSFVVLCLALLLPRLALADPPIPPLSGRIVDQARVIDDWTRSRLDTELADFEKAKGIQLVVVTLPNLAGYTVEDWGLALGRGWGIGQKGKNNGLLLIVAPKERKLRIEVGYGLEGDLPDATANGIIRDTIVPYFRAGDMPGGIAAGVDAIVTTLGGQVAGAAPVPRKSNSSPLASLVVPFAFFIFVGAFIMLGRGRRRVGPWGGPIIYTGSWPGGSRGGFGGGRSSSGGGFSGGGGSFAGGGASGGW